MRSLEFVGSKCYALNIVYGHKDSSFPHLTTLHILAILTVPKLINSDAKRDASRPWLQYETRDSPGKSLILFKIVGYRQKHEFMLSDADAAYLYIRSG